MFCMSLMKSENRAAFKAGEPAYLDRYPMSKAQRQAVLDRDWNRMISLGATSTTSRSSSSNDHKSFQHVAAIMDRQHPGGNTRR